VIDVAGILDAVVSDALALGVFDRVNGHEPKVAPGNGVTCGVWAQSMESIRASGLNSSSIRLVFNVRLYTSMLAEPQDAIDPGLLSALDSLLASYTGDFTLNGTSRMVDLLGSNGVGLSAQAGYVTQDSRTYRVFTVTLPIIVNDAWDQVP
jgi:hypothetical protein